MNRLSLAAALPLAFGAPLFAQHSSSATAVAPPLRVPLHSSPDDASYGLWSASLSYKASFHDGFVFYPMLGDAYPENLPVRWTTTSVRAGAEDLIAARAAKPTASGAWRCTYDFGAVAEVYDLREDGVEQSFVVRKRPALAGDLLVEGRISSALVAIRESTAGGALLLVDERGQAIVRYGEATAFDASGASLPVETELDGEIVRLRVRAADAARASYPLIIDPLFGRIALPMAHPVVATDIGCDPVGTGYNTMLALELAASASDHDVYLAMTTSDLSNYGWALHLIDPTDYRDPAVAFVRGADRWLATFSAPSNRILGYPHPRSSLALNAGGAPFEIATEALQADVGGTHSVIVDRAAVVYRSLSAINPSIRAKVVDPVAKTATSSYEVSSVPNPGYMRVAPAINAASSSDGWIVTWEEVEISPATTYIRANRFRVDGSIGTDATLSFHPNGQYVDVGRPQIAGAGGRYFASYLAGGNVNSDSAPILHTVRFDWFSFNSSPLLIAQRVLATAPSFGGFSGIAVAFDETSRSHWSVFARRSLLLGSSGALYKVGMTGGVVESAVVGAGTNATALSGAGVAFDGSRNRFAISYATNHASQPAYVDWLEYSGEQIPYGTSCTGTIFAPVDPDAGNENFQVALSGAYGATIAFLLIAPTSAAIPLAGAGMPGCSLYVDPSSLISIPAAVHTGNAELLVSLPDDPLVLGDAFCQWLVPSPGANAAGLVMTGGLELHVR